MEADISIWRKPGHFYFALTAKNRQSSRVGEGKESRNKAVKLFVSIRIVHL